MKKSVNPFDKIDREMVAVQARLAVLARERKILEFNQDPDAYEAKIRSAEANGHGKDGIYKRPAGTRKTINSMILEVFDDFPGKEFHAGLMLSRLLDRGWVTRNRSPKQAVSIAFKILCDSGVLRRVSHGIYVKA